MRGYILSIFFLIVVTINTKAQCLTDFSKLVPEPSIDYSLNFGTSFSIYDDYLAIGVPNSDSLGRLTGIVEIYQRINDKYIKIASMAPSDPIDAMQFGSLVKLSKDYLLVSVNPSSYTGGKVYLFKKPINGWTSATESSYFKEPGVSYFGLGGPVIEISPDQNTIIIGDPFYRAASLPPNASGALFVYHKSITNEWTSGTTPSTIITAPEKDVQDFGRSGIAIMEDRIVTATPYAPTGNGTMFVYRDVSGVYTNFQLEARLISGSVADSFFLGINNLVANDNGIFTSATIDVQTNPRFGIIYFERPSSGNWIDAGPTCFIEPDGDLSVPNNTPLRLEIQGNTLVATSRDNAGKAYLIKLTKGTSGWCDPSREIIETYQTGNPEIGNNYGYVMATDQTTNHIAVGFVAHPETEYAQIAIKVYNNQNNAWVNQLLYPLKKSTAGHFFGRQVFGFDNFLFVSAPGDGSVKSNAGAVYCYQKSGTTWSKIGKILPPAGKRYDDVFGSALASNKTYLAIAALGHEPHGKIFMYKKKTANWSEVDLVQEIVLPENLFPGIVQYGDYLAMSDEWLVIPYVQNSPARIFLTFHKFNGTTWDYTQTLELMNSNFFARYSTVAVAIEGDLVVAGGYIVERNANDVWEKRYRLTPSDPEPQRISPDFKYWITNGDSFGTSVAIHDNTIFIGAPTKDFGSTWDVGAVYVYTKPPGTSWSSRTETIKLVPRVKNERELFGYSLHAQFNTLLVGAPGSDYNKDGTARNKPGRAYVFQSEDYYWENVVPLVDFTGDSFIKDYYGLAVYMDRSDFYMGAAIEDIDNAKLSGSVYVTPAPPIIKLVPPVCVTNGTHTLLGYPFGGTWSGPGIIDAQKGIVDLTSAGVGTHEYIYVTPSCYYPGKMRIRIDPPPLANLTSNTKFEICTSTTTFNIQLGVQPQPNCFYLWYYREDPSKEFTSLEIRSASMIATKRGEYQVKVYNQSCETLSPIIRIFNESVELNIQSPEKLCNSNSPVLLVADPPGGQWSGPGISGNYFNPKLLTSGVYTIRYQYISLNGCQFVKHQEIEVFDAFNTIIVEPQGEKIDVCYGNDITLKLPHGLTFTGLTWYYYESDKNLSEDIASNVLSLTPTSSGYYYATLTRGVCSSVTTPKQIILHPKDSVFIPNIITANGDHHNELFKVITTSDEVSLMVMNRYGNRVYFGDGTKGWNGGNESSGVYFWQATLKTCSGERKVYKGTVHLVR